MASEWAEVDVILMEDETAIAVQQRGPLVRLHINSDDDHEGAAIVLNADARDQFAKAWAEAERQAEAWAAAQ